MSKQYSVQATPEAQEAGAVALAVASLPATFGPATGTPDVMVINGRPGWTTEAKDAIDAGARGVIVVNPAPESVQELQEAAEANGTPVLLDQRWASNPAVPGAEDAIRTMSGRAVLLDSVATAEAGTDPAGLLADHLAAVVRLTGPLENLRRINHGQHGYTLSAQLPNGAPAALQGILTGARPAGVHISLLTDDGGVSVALPEPLAAWPATVKATGPQGELLLPTLYESAHRATWRRLKEHLDRGTTSPDLHRFAALTESLSTLS
ncbi:hypothetical protein AAHB33_02930 [Paenarthrobacter sp. S56]|uniref:hypothetical protein n=1 Tax=Paenarthrobacter sp. S56 TaxID=3138179 RepID=UPI00321B895E